MSKTIGSLLIAFFTGIPGAFFTFVDPRTVVSMGLGFARHNDRVLIGVLLLIISFVSVYKFLTLILNKTEKKKKSSKSAKRRKK